MARWLSIVALHVAMWAVSLAGSLTLRFEFSVPTLVWRQVPIWLAALVVSRIAAFQALGLFRGLWRYTGTHDAWRLFLAQVLSSAGFATLVFLAGPGGLPRSVVVIEWLISFGAAGGVRLAFRLLRRGLPLPRRGERRLLIVGAGDAGEMLLREIQRNELKRYDPVGFVDDDRRKRGVHIHGVSVLGGIDRIGEFVARYGVEEIIIAIPTANGPRMRRIHELCKPTKARILTIPSLDGLAEGRVTVQQVRDVAIEDLLGREPVQLDQAGIAQAIQGKVVLVTGAGGSIGSELCRQVCRFEPAHLVLLERTENNLFEIHRELQARYPTCPLSPVVADVSDEARLEKVFSLHQPAVVFHAAAHKHVPMMESNPGESVKNNVQGTRCLANVSDRHQVERFVMISTDKAVNPTSVMGASKRTAEIYVQALSQRSGTRFVTVRFGNVLGSAGSVIPIFRQQILAGGPVTVTHPEMTRYFMTIPEASQLVLQAGAMGDGGEIFVLDMGNPVRIVDLARDLITLSGLRPDVDIKIEFVGIRPGEKLFEELATTCEQATKTRHPKIFVGRFRQYGWEQVCQKIGELEALADASQDEIRSKYAELVPEYRSGRPIRKSMVGSPLARVVKTA